MNAPARCRHTTVRYRAEPSQLSAREQPTRGYGKTGERIKPQQVVEKIFEISRGEAIINTGTKLVFLAAVFEPQTAAVIRKQIIPCNGNGVGISCSGIAGKEKEISCQDMGGTMFGDYQVTDFLEGFPA